MRCNDIASQVDSFQRPVNPQLVFQVQGTHWVLPFDAEVQKFAEEDIYLIIFDVFYNAGMELVCAALRLFAKCQILTCPFV